MIERQEEIKAISNSLTITVSDLPVQQRPKTYTGAIGKFNINSSIDRNEVQVGEPFLLNINIKGNGLLEPIKVPLFEKLPQFSENFKIYMDNIDGEIKRKSKNFFKQL